MLHIHMSHVLLLHLHSWLKLSKKVSLRSTSNVLIRTRIKNACLDRKNHGLEIDRDKICKDSTTKNTYPQLPRNDLPKSAKTLAHY